MIIYIGVYGIQGKDKCAHTLSTIIKKRDINTISGFDIILGTDIFFVGMTFIFWMFGAAFYYEDDNYTKFKRALCYTMGSVVCLISTVLFCYSVYVTEPIYGSYNSWKRETINCSSPIFYTAFAYLTIQYTVIGLFIIGFFVCFIVIAIVALDSDS